MYYMMVKNRNNINLFSEKKRFFYDQVDFGCQMKIYEDLNKLLKKNRFNKKKRKRNWNPPLHICGFNRFYFSCIVSMSMRSIDFQYTHTTRQTPFHETIFWSFFSRMCELWILIMHVWSAFNVGAMMIVGKFNDEFDKRHAWMVLFPQTKQRNVFFSRIRAIFVPCEANSKFKYFTSIKIKSVHIHMWICYI